MLSGAESKSFNILHDTLYASDLRRIVKSITCPDRKSSNLFREIKVWCLPLLTIFQFQQPDGQLHRLFLQSSRGNQSANFKKECTEITCPFKGRLC